ncbi:carbohydrate kinase [Nocardia stercoris]|uniref:Carbohydrate kinase n=2 Tax=Nocardia stercoris TaxID=2483361 RepID=A0A3M2L2U9_9NOCA|nr:carbohydrate kinase [Nocardia stercoris]
MNPAYDLTYRLPELVRGREHRVLSVEQRIGGKGLNVTRVLNQLGKYSRATGFADHAFAAAAEQELPVDFVTVLPWVRRTVVISESDDATATALREPGPRVSEPQAAVQQLRIRVQGLLPDTRGLVVSGSLPAGVSPAVPADLARMALAVDIPVVCDVSGRALELAAEVPGVVLMTDRDELIALTGADVTTAAEVENAVLPLLAAGVRAILVSLGAAGTVLATAAGCWSARLPEPVPGNQAGTGEAAAAAMISMLSETAEPEWPDLLTDAVATAAAALVIPVAGEIDRSVLRRTRPLVEITGPAAAVGDGSACSAQA